MEVFMRGQYFKLIFALISILIGLVFLFLNKQIIRVQGESKAGDYSKEIRIKSFQVGGIFAILGGIFLLFEYFS